VGLATRYYFLSECYCLKCAVLYILGALSDERTGLQHFEVGSYFTTDSQSVCVGIEHPCGTCYQILLPVGMLLSEICSLVSMGRPL
jgi:cytidine deaminase